MTSKLKLIKEANPLSEPILPEARVVEYVGIESRVLFEGSAKECQVFIETDPRVRFLSNVVIIYHPRIEILYARAIPCIEEEKRCDGDGYFFVAYRDDQGYHARQLSTFEGEDTWGRDVPSLEALRLLLKEEFRRDVLAEQEGGRP